MSAVRARHRRIHDLRHGHRRCVNQKRCQQEAQRNKYEMRARDAYTQRCCGEADSGCFQAPPCASSLIELENVKGSGLGSLSVAGHYFPMQWGWVAHVCYIYTKRPAEKGVIRNVGVLVHQI
jgi:hypothetical protein